MEIDRETIRLVRTFNRQIIRQLRLLNRGLAGTGLNGIQGDILCEIARAGVTSPRQLATSLPIDKGFLSRNLKALEQRHLVNRVRNKIDSRKWEFVLTEAGKEIAAEVDDRANRQIAELLKSLKSFELHKVVSGLGTYGRTMGLRIEPPRSVTIRPHRIGDAGYLIFLHGILYSEEYGLDSSFEAQVGQEITEFVSQFDPQWNGFWVAEADGLVVGAIVIVHRSREAAQLRWFIIYPSYRGLGLGRKLMTCAIDFCRAKQYRKVFLWTFDEFHAAMHLYRSFGFKKTETKTHSCWGRNLTEERHELDLAGGLWPGT
jgi:DNA-binding MarR family transcriptional regulator/N-acetylglutamate synthase-like GNAT family acetyltransferase